MRIVVVNIAASRGGALSILKDFYEYIKQNDNKHEWIFLLSDMYIEETERIKVIINQESKSNWYKRLKWEVRDGAKYINNLKPDVVFSMQNTICKGIKTPTMIYLHQSIPFQEVKKFSFIKKEERKLAIYQYLIGYIIKGSLKRTNKIVVQTKWMKSAVEKLRNVSGENIIVAPPTVKVSSEQVSATYSEINKFFYPSGSGIYKNHKLIVSCAKSLVEEGIKNFTIELTLDNKYKDVLEIDDQIQDNIKLIGHINRKEVYQKYSKTVLIFPSYIETFGLPLLEARMSNSYILASDCEFSKEVLEGYKNVEYFNPFLNQDLINQMRKIILEGCSLQKEQYGLKQIDGWKKIISSLEELGD